MALRFFDGFDHLAVGDQSQKWTQAAPASMQTGRVGTGQCVRLGSTPAYMIKTIDAQASWVVGCAFRCSSYSGGGLSVLAFKDAGTYQCELRINNDGTLSVTRNGTAVTGGTSTAVVSTSTWYYIEMKVTIADSIGANTCKVRLNGVDIITVTTGQDLKNTTNATANQIQFGPNSSLSGATWDYDDAYVCDGTGTVNKDFLGDCRIETLYPSGTGNSSQWTGNTGQTWGQLLGSTTTGVNIGLSSGVIVYTQVTAPFTGTVSQIQAIASSGITGKVNAAIYSDSGTSAPTALLGQATELTNPTTGTVTFTLQSTVNVTKGTTYWIALWANTTANIFNGAVSITKALQTLTYASTFPSTAASGGSTTGNSPYLVGDLTSIPKYQLVGETISDGDTGCVESSTTTNKDTYTLGDLSSSPSSIYGIQTVLVARKTDAGSRTVAPVLRSGGTDYDGTTVALADSYQALCEVKETDPATSAAWTAAGINALEAGVKLVA